MLDQALQQSAQALTISRRQRLEEYFLGRLDLSVKAFQLGCPRWCELHQVAPPVLHVAHTRDQSIVLQLAEDGVEVTAVDPQAPPQSRLAGRALLGQRAQHGEVLPAHSLLGQCVGDQPACVPRHLARLPARQLLEALRGRIISAPWIGPSHGRSR